MGVSQNEIQFVIGALQQFVDQTKTVLIALKHLYALVLWLQDDDDVYLYDDADRIKMQGRWVH